VVQETSSGLVTSILWGSTDLKRGGGGPLDLGEGTGSSFGEQNRVCCKSGWAYSLKDNGVSPRDRL